ncbi:hypothetical protein KP509_19G005800 [Ceratopteris richardii]|nr:hypothetical protein KP509_19G005800 [Ceratopteris richardii]
MKKAVRVGETGVREVAAYLLDHENFAKVPPTVLVKVAHHAFHVNGSPVGCKKPGKIGQMVSKLASCQQFVHHDYDASDHGTSRFSVAAVHRIGILDIRILNTDRHAGNILIRDVKPAENPWRFSNVHVNESLELIPIDHGLCLPEALEDPYFEWLHWPQASLPFSEEELDYISRLNGYEDANILHQELPMLREACYRILILCTTFLKRAAAAGFFLAEIGGMMTRDRMEEASQLELLCMQAKLNVEKDLAEKLYINDGYDDDVSTPENSFADETHEQFEFEMDHDSRYNAGSIADSTKLPMDWTNLSLSDLPSLPVHLSNRKEPTINNLNYFNDFHRSGAYLQICSGMSAPETKRLGSLCKFSACTPNLCNGDSSGFPQSLSLEGKPDTGFPRRTFSERGSRLKSEICPLAEEEEILSFADKNEKSPNSSKEQSLRSPRPTSLRGVSFYNQKKNYTNVSDSKTTVGKVNVSGSLVPFSPGDMSDEQWALFMDHFDNLLEIMLANRSSNVNYCQRLGISCQF